MMCRSKYYLIVSIDSLHQSFISWPYFYFTQDKNAQQAIAFKRFAFFLWRVHKGTHLISRNNCDKELRNIFAGKRLGWKWASPTKETIGTGTQAGEFSPPVNTTAPHRKTIRLRQSHKRCFN